MLDVHFFKSDVKYADVSKHRLLTGPAPIGATTVGAESLEYATEFLKPRTKLAAQAKSREREIGVTAIPLDNARRSDSEPRS
jgi:hypothetical protein